MEKDLENKPKAVEEKDTSTIPSIRKVAQVSQAQFVYRGPLPPAAQLKGYEDVLPGAADRIITMAETQSTHRQQIEKAVIAARTRDSLLGILGAIILAVSILIGSVVCILANHDAAGGVMITGVLVALCTVFIKGTSLKNQSLEIEQKGNKIPDSVHDETHNEENEDNSKNN